jgi:hypothetical protein
MLLTIHTKRWQIYVLLALHEPTALHEIHMEVYLCFEINCYIPQDIKLVMNERYILNIFDSTCL